MPPLQQTPIQNPLDGRHQGKHNKPLFFSALIISLAILIFAIWYGYDKQVEQARDEETARLIAQTDLIKDPTTDWKTYRNEEYGFEFKYPETWYKLDVINKDIYVSNIDKVPDLSEEFIKNNSNFSIKILKNINTKNLNLEDWYKEFTKVGFANEPKSKEMIFIGGRSAVKINLPEIGSNYHIYVPVNIDLIEIVFPSSQLNYNQVYNKILSTFKFISTSTNVSVKSGVKGKVTIGPTCPMMREPPDSNCEDKPYQAILNVVDSAGKKVVSNKINADGTFQFDLAPGKYVIGNGNTAVMPTLSPAPFTVEANKYVEINLVFDSGIR